LKLAIGSAVLAIAFLTTHAFAQSPVEPTGTWLTEDGRAKIRIEHCNEASGLCGYVVWLKDPLNDKGQPRTDIYNPDPAKRNRPSLGMQLISSLKVDEDQHFAGDIYNADNGKTYAITLAVEKSNELRVRGCMMHILCGSQSWSRVPDLPVPGTHVVSTTASVPKSAKAGARHDVAPAAPAQ
jgi:uncharacterized protein (DUF2147 family)